MSKPDISTQAFGYTLTWEDEQISVKVGLIRLHKAGNVTAEVEFSTTNKQWNPFLHRSHLNLSSGTSMKQTAKFLTSRYDKDLLSEEAWGEIIELLCYKVINLTRMGDEAVEVWPQETRVPPPKYLLDPIIQQGQANLLFGDRTAGKTQIALLCSAIISLPWYDNPLKFVVPDTQIKTLWLDWETDKDSFDYLYNELQRGMGMVFGPISYRRCRSSLPNDVEQIAYWIDKAKAAFIVVDHVGLAAGGPLNDDITATVYFEAVRKLNVTSLHLAHQSKDPNSKKKTAFGSAFWENIPRTVWEIKKLAEAEDSLDTVMTLTKRNIGAKVPPFGMKFTYNEAGTHVDKFNPNDVQEYVQQTSAKNRIVLLLRREGPMSSAVIAEELGIPETTVRVNLNARMKGQVIKVGQEWGLIDHEH